MQEVEEKDEERGQNNHQSNLKRFVPTSGEVAGREADEQCVVRKIESRGEGE